jgi:hypothetical protein
MRQSNKFNLVIWKKIFMAARIYWQCICLYPRIALILQGFNNFCICNSVVGANGAGKTSLLRILAGKRLVKDKVLVQGQHAYFNTPEV